MKNIWQYDNENKPLNGQIMFMGTGSDVGKSLIVAALCRLFANQKIKVAPFKSQNMSNNAAIAQIFDIKAQKPTMQMGEIGRAQWLQAKAAKIAPTTHMNPILLKPESETGSQVIINGKKFKSLTAKQYYQYKSKFLKTILECFSALKAAHNLIIVEGAGSPAEVNLRKNDIANMGFAEQANLPVILIGDIDRGGVIASIVGTYEVMCKADRDRIKGFIINKFRGDISLFDDATTQIEKMTGWQCLGILPYFPDAHLLPAEDSVVLEKPQVSTTKKILILVPKLPQISNFDDLDPLSQMPNVEVRIIKPGKPLPINADLIILPGSKSTIADLEFLYAQGWDIDIKSHLRHGGKILGICGGFQMLGKTITDPNQIESKKAKIKGLGLLDIETEITLEKSTNLVEATDLNGNKISAYEIHLGKSTGKDMDKPMFKIDSRNLGATSKNGQVMGSYLHGIFSNDSFRQNFLNQPAAQNYNLNIENTLDKLAEHTNKHLNIKQIMQIATSK